MKMKRIALLLALVAASSQIPAPAANGRAGAAPNHVATVRASSAPTPWETVTSSRDATPLTALAVVRGVGSAAGAAVTIPFLGRVHALHVAPGDTVHAGTPLVDVDVPELAVAAAAAIGARGEASVHAERLEALRGLLEEGLVRAEELHENERLLAEVRTRRRVALAKLRAAGLDDRAAAQVARHGFITLTSPIDGTVISVDARLGAATSMKASLVRVVGEGEVRIEARLAQPFQGAATLRTPRGDIALRPLGPSVRDPESGLWFAFFAPVGDGVDLRDGERHRIALEGMTEDNIFEVPTNALRLRSGEEIPSGAAEVQRRRGDARAWVPVTVIRAGGARAIVRSPELRAGDAVAVDPS